MELSENVLKTGESGREGQVTGPPNEFVSDDALCNHLRRMKVREASDGITVKWGLGISIRSHYKMERGYGRDDLGKIAQKTGWSKSSLQKACQFAEKYSPEQVETLLRGRFSLSWRNISQNLSLEPQAIVNAYSGAQTPKVFRNSVIQLRQPLQGGTPSPRPKTRKELERDLSERDQKIANLENRIQALEAMTAGSTNSDELAGAEEIETEITPLGGDNPPNRWEENLEKMVAA